MPAKKARPGFGMLAILLSAVGIAPLLNYGLNATSDLVIRDLGITESQFGLLATVCFGCAALGNAAFGKFSDKQPDTRLLLLILAPPRWHWAWLQFRPGSSCSWWRAAGPGFGSPCPNGGPHPFWCNAFPAPNESRGRASSNPACRFPSLWEAWDSPCWPQSLAGMGLRW